MRKSLHVTGLLMMFLLISMAGFSQYTVKGTVTDATKNEPLANVSVIIKGTKNGTITGVDGTFTLIFLTTSRLHLLFL